MSKKKTDKLKVFRTKTPTSKKVKIRANTNDRFWVASAILAEVKLWSYELLSDSIVERVKSNIEVYCFHDDVDYTNHLIETCPGFLDFINMVLKMPMPEVIHLIHCNDIDTHVRSYLKRFNHYQLEMMAFAAESFNLAMAENKQVEMIANAMELPPETAPTYWDREEADKKKTLDKLKVVDCEHQ